MNKITINFVNNLPYGSRCFVDGNETVIKRQKNGISEVVVETDKDKAEIRIANVSMVFLPFWKWFLSTLFFWVISVFGVFDSVSDKTGRVLDVNLTVKTTENAFVKMKFNLFKKDNPAVEVVETDTEIQEISNIYRIDKQAGRRNKAYKIVRIISLIAVAIGVMFLAF